MHPLLDQFLEKWVWPTAPGARGAPFRLRITEEKCLKGWEIALHSSLTEIEKGLASGSDDWQRRVALGGYAGEGVQMSIRCQPSSSRSISPSRRNTSTCNACGHDKSGMSANTVWKNLTFLFCYLLTILRKVYS
jgi:hypothetical protein